MTLCAADALSKLLVALTVSVLDKAHLTGGTWLSPGSVPTATALVRNATISGVDARNFAGGTRNTDDWRCSAPEQD